MSDQIVEGERTQEPQGERTEENKKDINLEAMQSKLQRLEDESKKYKKLFQDRNSKLEEIERSRVEKDGTWEEKLEAERKRATQLQETLKQREENLLMSNIRSTFSEIAKDAHNVDDLIKEDSLLDSVKIDEETFSIDKDSAKEAINRLREGKPYLFGAKKLAKQAEGQPRPDMREKSLNDMTSNEKKLLMKKALENWS